MWGEYCRLRKEVKQLVIEKKLNIWNELVEKVNTDFDENRKVFWAFVGRKSKGKKKNIASLKSDTGLSLTSARGKLVVLQRHYQLLSNMSVDSVFDADWKEEVGDNVKGYSSLSEEVTDSLLDKEIEKGEITKCLRNLKNSKTGGNDGIVGELLKYGGFGMLDLLEQLFSVIWQEEIVPRQWRKGHDGQAGFRTNRSCMDNVYTLNEIVQGRLREDKKTYAFFLDIQKAYDSVWHDGLWYKLWDMGVKGRMWRVIKKMYESSKSAVLLEGEKSDTFTIEQGVAQGCSLSPILFSVFVNDLLKEVEQTGLGIQLSSGKTVGGMLFANDFVGISDSKESLQKLLDIVYSYCSKWRSRANGSKSAVMVFSKDAENGCWKWGEYSLPIVSSSKIDVSTFDDRCVDFRRSMCRLSKIDDRCVDLGRSTIDVSTFEDRCVDLRRSMC